MEDKNVAKQTLTIRENIYLNITEICRLSYTYQLDKLSQQIM